MNTVVENPKIENEAVAETMDYRIIINAAELADSLKYAKNFLDSTDSELPLFIEWDEEKHRINILATNKSTLYCKMFHLQKHFDIPVLPKPEKCKDITETRQSLLPYFCIPYEDVCVLGDLAACLNKDRYLTFYLNNLDDQGNCDVVVKIFDDKVLYSYSFRYDRWRSDLHVLFEKFETPAENIDNIFISIPNLKEVCKVFSKEKGIRMKIAPKKDMFLFELSDEDKPVQVKIISASMIKK